MRSWSVCWCPGIWKTGENRCGRVGEKETDRYLKHSFEMRTFLLSVRENQLLMAFLRSGFFFGDNDLSRDEIYTNIYLKLRQITML